MYIEKLKGTYESRLGTGIILDVAGVGYGLEMPLSSLCELPPLGHTVSLWTYTHVREDALRLFGFTTFQDRVAFELMLGLNGVGPKLALAILSTLSLSAIRRAVHYNDAQILVSVPGVGPRLAEKILLELRPKLDSLQDKEDSMISEMGTRRDGSDFEHILEDESYRQKDAMELIYSDVKSALENLGFKDKTVTPIIKSLKNENLGTTFQDVMRHALKLVADTSPKKGAKAAIKGSDKSFKKDRELF